AEGSSVARRRSSKVAGSNVSTAMRPAQPTSEAEITKRRFEYKAVSLTRGNLGPLPVAQKQRRCGGTMSFQQAPSQWNLQLCLMDRTALGRWPCPFCAPEEAGRVPG